MKASIAIADDHVQLRNGLANLLKEWGYDVLFEADNGKLFLEKISECTRTIIRLNGNQSSFALTSFDDESPFLAEQRMPPHSFENLNTKKVIKNNPDIFFIIAITSVYSQNDLINN